MFSMRLLLACVAPSAVSASFAFASGGGICAAASEDTTTYIGKKGNSACTDLNSVPAEYISMQCQGLAFLKGGKSAYLTDSSKAKIIDPSPDGTNGNHPLRVGPSAKMETGAGFKYGKAVAGSMMGDLSKSVYGFIGTASYLVTEGEISYNKNKFTVARKGSPTLTVDDVCVVPLTGAGACDDSDGAKRKGKPGTYKFSLFGYAAGSGYQAWASTYTHMGIRQRVSVDEMGTTPTVAFNDGSTTSVADINMGTTSINKVVISGDESKIMMTYPGDYNVGTVNSNNVPVPAATKTVTIHAVKNDAVSFFLDYIFELGDGLENELGYFVYDPSVSVPADSSSAFRPSVLGVAVLVVTCLARWF